MRIKTTATRSTRGVLEHPGRPADFLRAGVSASVGSLLLSGILAPAVPAAAAEAPPPKSFEIVRIPESEAPRIDGRVDEAIWQRAAVITDFDQFQPNEGVSPSQRTEFYVMHDKDAIYVAARFSDPQPLTANILRLGEVLMNEDRMTVMLDPFNDKRSGYRFNVNPNGIRADALYLESRTQWDWDGIYFAEAVRDATGWTAEMAIPFKTLSFDPSNGTWGINFGRAIARNSESIGWVYRNRNQTPGSSGEVTGMTGLDQGLGLDVVPGLSLRQEKNHVAGTSEFRTEPSLDVYYKVTPSLNAALTFNTDFSATEVDERQVNLSRFNLFFPEKRSFFLRDSDILEFGRLNGAEGTGGVSPVFSRPGLENGRPFFSRSIGLSSAGQPVDIIAGTKLSGRIGGIDVGALAIRQDEAGNVDARTLLVGRAVTNVLAESSLGLIVTNGDPRSNLDNSLVGADFRYLNTRLSRGRSLEGELWYERTETEGLDGDDAAYGLRLRSPNSNGWRGGLGVKELQENFNPALGYVNRRGVRNYTGEAGYTYRLASGFVQSLYSGIDHEQFDSIAGDELQTRVTTFRPLEITGRQNDAAQLNYVRSEEVLSSPFTISRGVVLPVGDYSFDEYEVKLQPSGSRKVSGTLAYRAGDFYSGERWRMTGKLLWKASPHFWFTGSYEYNDVTLPEGDFIVRLLASRFDVMFNARWSWVTLVQYDNVSGSVAAHSRLRWVPQAGREMFIVYNHNLLEDNGDGSFRSQRADGTVKFNYTFRF